MPLTFGTSGLRGLVTEMTPDRVAAWAAAFLVHVGAPRGAEVLIGRDLRPSSAGIAAAVAAGLRAAGARVFDCGVLPTPALALAATGRGVPAIMITGSHVPADRNGLKFYRPTGEITKADEAGIRAALPAAPPPAPEAPIPRDAGAAAAYRARYLAGWGPGALRDLRIGVYQHSAAGRDLLTAILGDLGAAPVALGRTDHFVPVDTEAVDPDTRRRLAGWARGLDAVVSTDGDGDRPMIADETGQVVAGDLIGPITARALGATALATPVSSNTAVDRMGVFRRVLRTRIGSPHVIAAMEALAAEGEARVLGYEANGGVLLGFDADGPAGRVAALKTRDAVLPIVATLADARARGGPVSALVAGLPGRRTAADLIRGLPADALATCAARLATDAAARAALLDGIGTEAGLDTTDGARITLADGRIVHIRPSGNAPELRCYAEAGSDAAAAALAAEVLARLRTVLSG